jgi:hypothetical protein
MASPCGDRPAATAHPTPRASQENRTPLHAAVLTGNPAVVRELIHHGATVEAMDAMGNTALHLACEQGSLAVVKELLANEERRAVVHTKNRDGVSPLHVAAQVGMRDIVMALVECGARADVRDNVSRRGCCRPCALAATHPAAAEPLLRARWRPRQGRRPAPAPVQAGRMPMDMVNPENHPVRQMLLAAGGQPGQPGRPQPPVSVSRQASQQHQQGGSPLAGSRSPMSPAGAGPASPLAVHRSMSAMALPGASASPRVTASNGGMQQASPQVSSALAMHQAGLRVNASMPGSPGASNPASIGVSARGRASSGGPRRVQRHASPPRRGRPPAY